MLRLNLGVIVCMLAAASPRTAVVAQTPTTPAEFWKASTSLGKVYYVSGVVDGGRYIACRMRASQALSVTHSGRHR